MKLWIGIDDTDSRKGMCTTYLAVLAIERLEEIGAKLIGFPRLIRLNPTIPYKTRGNGAVSFLIDVDEAKRDEVVDVVREVVEEFAELDEDNTNPGVVFVDDNSKAMDYLHKYSLKVVRDVVSIDTALFIIGKFMLPHLKFKKGRGLIGALASVGLELYDYTIEVLAYRKPEKFGTPREYDEESFFDADYETYPLTWDTVDWTNEVVVAVPNSPDPVLFGIRGDDFHAVMRAFEMVKTEPIDKYMVFITNQGTDMHLLREDEVDELKNYRSYILKGRVCTEPYDIPGGHVFFEIETKFGVVKCSAFEPTKQFRNIVRKLKKGDIVEVYGSMKRDTINLEKINVIELADVWVEENPICPKCGKRMDSAGKGKGFRCKRCKTRAFEKIRRRIERDLDTGFYEVPPCARRHLSKPLIRMKGVKRHIFR
jgi:tRNA(Ile2)-agmatinylcytidine synthase